MPSMGENMDWGSPVKAWWDLSGKVALVTGGARGIGASIAEELARAGARVAVVDVSPGLDLVLKIEEMGGQALALKGDVTDLAGAQEVVEEVRTRWGRLDILVLNAGITRDSVVWKMTEEAWDEVISVNLKGCFTYARAAAPHFRSQGSGRIILISSINGLRGKFGQANYAATKAGMIGFAKSLAKELGRSGVTVNVVAPGFISTPMTDAMPEEAKEKALGEIALGHAGTVEDIAWMVAFLASERARFITGEVIKVDGGQYI